MTAPWRRALLPLLLAVPVAILVAGQLGWFGGQKPQQMGLINGRLKPPSDTRNSVSSQTHLHPGHAQTAYAAITALPWREGGEAASMQALVAALAAQPGITLVEQTPDYVYVQARTRWLGFIDDLEFWSNPNTQVIEMRSASRLGQEDFGVNRQRMETIRAAYLAR